MNFVLQFIIGFFLFGGSLGIIFYLFDKLTADNIPTNLRNHTDTAFWTAVKLLVILFLVGGAIILALSL